MAINLDQDNRVLNGYHDKNVNKFGLVHSNYPVLTEEQHSPFLITRDHYFLINTEQITKMLSNYQALQSFHITVSRFANILIIPGLAISIAYVLRFAGLFKQMAIVENTLSSGITSFFFWISVLGVIILWHDYYRTKSHPTKLPTAETISPKIIETIKNTGFNFGRYAQLEAVHFLSEESQGLLTQFIKGDIFQTFEIFQHFVTNDHDVKDALKRSNILLTMEQFHGFNINNSTLPSYRISGLRSIIIYALEEALLTESKTIEPIHLFLALSRVFPAVQKVFQTQKNSIELLREVVRYHTTQQNYAESAGYFNPQNTYQRSGGIGEQWIYGYTFVLNHFSKDMTQAVANTKEVYGIGHEKEVEALSSILGRVSKKHSLLIGEPGVGKTSLVKGLAQMINRGEVPAQLRDKRIIQLDINGMIAHAGKKKNLEETVQSAMRELEKAGDTILFIDEIQELVPAKAQESGHSLAGVLLPYIMDSKFPIIGTVNYASYKKYFYSSESFRQSFSNVEISELSPKATMRILETKIAQLEKNFGLYITFPALSAATELAQRYDTNRMLPDSAVGTIEAACSWAQANEVKVLTNEHVAKSVSIQTNVSVESITSDEAGKLLQLQEEMSKKVIGQDDAIKTVVEALKRARTDLRDPNKPIGVFLFIGPTGVGKTHLAKSIAGEFFNDEDDIVRIDMSEYQDIESINKILGTSDNTGGTTLLDRVKSNPYTVILFDEIEKANPAILDLFLQLFDEGRLTSTAGETVNFTNTIIITTSNIGSRTLLKTLDENVGLWEEAKARVMIELKQFMKPELFNRYDDVVVFAPHTRDSLAKIAEILLIKLAGRLSEKGITLEWAKTIPVLIAEKSFDPALGARPLKRYIQEKIEGKIAQELLEQNVSSGDTLKVRSSWIV